MAQGQAGALETVPSVAKAALDVRRLGRVSYADGLALQETLVDERKRGVNDDILLLLEHDPAVTLGRNARAENLLLSEDLLRARGIGLFDVGRGGDDVFYAIPTNFISDPADGKLRPLMAGAWDATVELRTTADQRHVARPVP